MSKKVKTAKIIEGHSLDQYFKRFGKGYTNLKLHVTKNKSELKPGKKYWKIEDAYYQVNHSRGLKATIITLVSISVAANIALPIYFFVFANKERYIDYNFKYWNDCTALNTLKDYVKDTVNPKSSNYIPKVDRIATFDMDGTLFGERAPIYIEWLMYSDYYTNNKDKHPEWLDYFTYKYIDKTGGKEEEKTATDNCESLYNQVEIFKKNRTISDDYKYKLEMCEATGGAIVFSDLTISDYVKYVDKFLENNVAAFNNLKFKDMFYKPMIEVVEFLQINNFDVYIVSGTDRFMVRDIVNKHLTIPYNKVIGMDVNLVVGEDGVVRRGKQLMYKNVEKVKVELITQEIGKKPVLSFGNSGGDVEMHDYCLSNEKYKSAAFMVNNDDGDREYKQDRSKDWAKHPKYNVFSMKDNWKTIYGENVTKTGK